MFPTLERTSQLKENGRPSTETAVNNAPTTSSLEQLLTPLQPRTILLKDGETIATMYPIPAVPSFLPHELLMFLYDEFNMEIEKGDSFPYYDTLTLEEFEDIWFHSEGHVCIMVLGEIPELDYGADSEDSYSANNNDEIDTMRNTNQYRRRKEIRNLNLDIQWEKQCLGVFGLQPAYPGRSAHVVTGSFLVNAGIRGKGIGKTLVETFVEWSKKLGFTSCVFPLIYGTNVGIRRILEGLNFRRIGKLPESGILKGFDVPIDSFIYGKEFTHITKSIDLLKDPQKGNEVAKYERLKYYLETGKYPLNCDRNEKARIRMTAKKHSLLNGKLMTNDREVVYDPDKQRQIALEAHLVDHQGINKVTAKIVEKYHWKGIKQTVSEVIAQCTKCKIRYQDGTGVIVTPSDSVIQAHMLPTQTVDTEKLRHTNDNVGLVNSTGLENGSSGSVGNTFKRLQHKRESSGQQQNLEKRQGNKRPGIFNEGEPTPSDAANTHGPLSSDFNLINSADNDRMLAPKAVETDDRIRKENNQFMNTFNELVKKDGGTKRRRYLDAATNAMVNKDNTTADVTVSSSKSSAKKVTTYNTTHNNLNSILENDSTNIMNDAMLHLEDNVMAALEMVQKEQREEEKRQEQSIDDFFNTFIANYQEEEDADYEETMARDGDEEDDEDEDEEDEEDDEEAVDDDDGEYDEGRTAHDSSIIYEDTQRKYY
ncbi:hypothetical protein KAFR_0G01790 [Kazachstania africana CBS 2517]|uniref:N-acetyltransferase domain-containing protein n=1 Tax=Kazachstania africana (strain ATCC 22294 / BCRC 22015 / CBS 2517 / CECT 1963 / NBRC 1671 / NRRL Y-8276) TaxID=1071382 RepID=H2AXW3_KAZAF|nr:hypothetical protein KAFR_0G01790 [Kazachstania africana CBS 2517]CCF59213.1 hypothetical protein KAFR_0G01790 [Kazachstania africana CBS 2517]